jgi:DNA-binding beta-propeller fold protein YncE
MKFATQLFFAIASSGLMVMATATTAKSVTLTYDRSIGRPANLAAGEFPGVPGTLAVPQGIAVQETTGLIYIANGRFIDRIDVFDSQGNYIKGIGGTGSGPGQFDEPAAIAFDPDTGNLYAGDVFNDRVNVFDAEGNYLNSFGDFGQLIPGRAFFGPSSITFDAEGFVYVGDFSNDKINKYTKEGELIDSIGTSGTEPGQFQGPAGVQISPVSGNFFVTDQFNNRVQVLSPTGEPLLVFGELGSGPGQFIQPIDIEVDEFENIYVMDSINSRVQVFDKNGNFLTQFGRPSGGRPPQLGEPSPYGDPLDLSPGVFNWTAGSYYSNNKLYVGDFFQGRVQVLNVNNADPAATVPEPSSLLGLLAWGLSAAVIKRVRKDG